MKTKLTVTIPSYRQPEQLKRALLGLSLQTFKDFNILIIDDNSGVDIQKIAELYKDTLTISIIENNRNIGAMSNIEKSILTEVNSDYIFSHHEDDYIKTNYLEEAVAILESDPKISFVLSSATWVTKDEEYIQSTAKKRTLVIFSAEEFMLASLKQETFIFGSVIYRKQDIQSSFELSAYETYCDKIFLNQILLKNNSFCGYFKESFIYVRDHSKDEKDSRSDKATIDHLINFLHFYKMHLKDSKITRQLITNNLLLGYIHLRKKISFVDFYKKQKKYNLFYFRDINSLGLYSIATILFGKRVSNLVIKLRKHCKKSL